MRNPIQFSIELCPPIKPSNIPAYYSRLEPVLGLTDSFSLSSHPVGSISGFERSHNLANYLLERAPGLDLMFHLTCRDLNRVNIHQRLGELHGMHVRRILLISGENYTDSEQNSPENFVNSAELLRYIHANYANWFQSVAVAAYPGGNELTSFDDRQECDRLLKKVTSDSGQHLMVDTIYTQCIFDMQTFSSFANTLKRSVGDSHATPIQLVPSVSLFTSAESLERCSTLTKVKLNKQLSNRLKYSRHQSDWQTFAKSHLVDLCRALLVDELGVRHIHICAFQLFAFTREIIQEILSVH